MPDTSPQALSTHTCHVAYLLKIITAQLLIIKLMKNCFDSLDFRNIDNFFNSLQLRDLDCLLHNLHLRNMHDLDDWPVHKRRRGRARAA